MMKQGVIRGSWVVAAVAAVTLGLVATVTVRAEESVPALSDVQGLGVMEYRMPNAPDVVAGRIRLTQNDVLWMARMLRGEAYGFGRTHYATVLYTVAQRLWYLPAFREVDSFTTFMRAFSQPINPRFTDVNSRNCDRYRAQCGEAFLARRNRIQNLQWEEIPAELRLIAIEFAQGRLRNPAPLSIDFARAYGPNDCINKGTRVLMHDPIEGRRRHVFCRPRTDAQAPLLTVVAE